MTSPQGGCWLGQDEHAVANGANESKSEPWLSVPPIDYQVIVDFLSLKNDQIWTRISPAFGSATMRGDGTRLFWKTMQDKASLHAELKGLYYLNTSFPRERLQQPLYVDSSNNRIFYRFLDHRTLFQYRFELLVHKFNSHDQAQMDERLRLEHIFLDFCTRRNRDNLNAYMSTLHVANIEMLQRDQSPNHARYFKGILGAYEMFAGQLPAGLTTGNTSLTLEQFLDYKFCVNGREYRTLRFYIDELSHSFTPEAFEGLAVVIGHGDGHSGNILVEDFAIGGALTYIDYELAGLQNPFVAMARETVMDCFFTAQYFDDVAEAIARQEGESNDHVIVVETDYTTRTIYMKHSYWNGSGAASWDTFGQRLFDNRYNGIILPLANFLSKQSKYRRDVQTWHEIFGRAMWVTCVLRPFPCSWKKRLLTIGIGFELWDFQTWLRERWEPVESKICSQRFDTETA